MDDLNAKEYYYFFTIETVLIDNPELDVLEEHLKYYESQEQYMECAGIKLGIEFARFNKLIQLKKQLQND